MNTRAKSGNQLTMEPSNLAVAGVAALLLLLPVAGWSGGVVTNCTEANLRAAMAGGGTVTFACDGIITLTNPITVLSNTSLDGAGHQLTISGGNAVRVFQVSANTAFSLAHVTIANGLSTNGGGIYNAGGTVEATNCVFTANQALAANGTSYIDPNGKAGCGGAIYNAGVVRAIRCAFSWNSARGGNGFDAVSLSSHAGIGGPAEGGAIYNASLVSASQCGFSNNFADGGAGGAGYTYASDAAAFGGSGGGARAGAICNAGTMSIDGSLFAANEANGGSGGNGRNSPSTGWGFFGLNNGGFGGAGGAACGAVFPGGPTALVNCTLAGNLAQGGAGGRGGDCGFFNDMGTGLPIYGYGGPGGNGGDAQAALYDTTGVLRLTNCTVAHNRAVGGVGGSDGANGPGIPRGSPGDLGFAGGAMVTSNSVLLNTLLAINDPRNLAGTITDAGHNLSSDASSGFTNGTSLKNTDPRLGPLANNGGPTLTMGLLPGSPAIDAGDNAAAPATDQRGIPRPVGLFADIGAYEFTAMLQISLTPETGVNVLVYGPTNQRCRLLMTTNLSDWQCVATNQIGPDGTFLFQDNCSADETKRFYQVALP